MEDIKEMSAEEKKAAIIADAEAFRDGKMTISQLKSNPVLVEGDRALLINAIHFLYQPESTKDDLAKAIEDLKELAVKGDVYANTLLGVLYSEGGEAVSYDLKNAESYLKEGLALGGVTAQYRLGILYLQDNDLRNPEEGVKLIREAAMKGLKEALNSLGDIYRKGVTVEKSLEQAKKFYRLAADRYLGEAFYNLSKLSEDKNEIADLENQAALFGYDKENHSQNYLLLAFQG